MNVPSIALPDAVIKHRLVSFLNLDSVLALSALSKHWRLVLCSEAVWANLYARDLNKQCIQPAQVPELLNLLFQMQGPDKCDRALRQLGLAPVYHRFVDQLDGLRVDHPTLGTLFDDFGDSFGLAFAQPWQQAVETVKMEARRERKHSVVAGCSATTTYMPTNLTLPSWPAWFECRSLITLWRRCQKEERPRCIAEQNDKAVHRGDSKEVPVAIRPAPTSVCLLLGPLAKSHALYLAEFRHRSTMCTVTARQLQSAHRFLLLNVLLTLWLVSAFPIVGAVVFGVLAASLNHEHGFDGALPLDSGTALRLCLYVLVVFLGVAALPVLSPLAWHIYSRYYPDQFTDAAVARWSHTRRLLRAYFGKPEDFACVHVPLLWLYSYVLIALWVPIYFWPPAQPAVQGVLVAALTTLLLLPLCYLIAFSVKRLLRYPNGPFLFARGWFSLFVLLCALTVGLCATHLFYGDGPSWKMQLAPLQLALVVALAAIAYTSYHRIPLVYGEFEVNERLVGATTNAASAARVCLLLAFLVLLGIQLDACSSSAQQQQCINWFGMFAPLMLLLMLVAPIGWRAAQLTADLLMRRVRMTGLRNLWSEVQLTDLQRAQIRGLALE